MTGMGFYSTAAQVIPLLVLVLVIEFPMRSLWSYLPRHLRFIVFAELAFCGAGEWRALRVLQTEHATRLDSGLVWITLFGLAMGIVVGATGSPFSRARSLTEHPDVAAFTDQKPPPPRVDQPRPADLKPPEE